jgi:ABC-type phosphate/phosphonate transport system ATPase subunit
MVTHELDIARYTTRMVILRDGVIVTDEPVRDRSDATQALQRLRAAHEAVKLG